MIGERTYLPEENNYGTLTLRPYTIQGNELDAFYDSSNNLIFVLDKTINENKPNVLLVINPDGDKKWDEILSGQYLMDLETIRPKVDNKYQKLDIEYSGLSIYDNLIHAYVSGDGLEEQLTQLDILRDSAVRHSAMMRLNMANEIISKTNITIVKTKESIIRLQERIKTLKTKLSATKREIGKVSTKQSAAKILRIESQIEAANEKLKRAKKRLASAQRRLETATVDAELAGNLLNQPALEVPQPIKVKPVVAAPERPVKKVEPEIEKPTFDYDYNVEENDDSEDEEVVESDVKPLFTEDPQIMNEDIAFKPISFDVPATETEEESEQEPSFVPVYTPESYSAEEEVKEEPESNPYEKAPWDFSDSEPEDETEVESEPERTVLETLSPIVEEKSESFEPIPVSNTFQNTPMEEPESIMPRPVLETLTPPSYNNEEPELPEPVVPEYNYSEEVAPVPPAPVFNEEERPLPPAMESDESELSEPAKQVEPVEPVINNFSETKVVPVDSNSGRKTPFLYYVFLILLIALSIFTLWLYQKSMSNTTPDLVEVVQEKPIEEPVVEQIVVEDPEVVEVSVVEEPVAVEEQPEETPIKEPVEEAEPIIEEDSEPTISGNVPSKYLTSGQLEEEQVVIDAVINKPVYEVGSRHDDMFVPAKSYRNSNKNVAAPAPAPAPVVQQPKQKPAPAFEETYYDENDVLFDDDEYYGY